MLGLSTRRPRIGEWADKFSGRGKASSGLQNRGGLSRRGLGPFAGRGRTSAALRCAQLARSFAGDRIARASAGRVLLAWMFDIGRGGIARDPLDVAARPDIDRDIANMSTMIGGDLGPGAVIVRWNGIGGENAVIFLEEFFLGRADQCRVRFYDPLVSRKHARIFCEDNAWWIEDLGSRNGTLVDEKQVARSILPKECEIRVNEAGPVLRLELVPPGPQMRLAISATSPGEIVAHVRNASSGFQPKQDSDVTKE
jgi:hypothetical protein